MRAFIVLLHRLHTTNFVITGSLPQFGEEILIANTSGAKKSQSANGAVFAASTLKLETPSKASAGLN